MSAMTPVGAQRPGGGGLQPRPVLKPMGIDAGKTAELLAKIESAIDHIMLENSSHLSFEELYRLILYKMGDALYARVTAKLRAHMVTISDHLLAASNEALLPLLDEAYKKLHLHMCMVRDILMYMDRTYVAQQSKLPVYALARLCFQEGVVWNAKLRDRISCQLLEGVEALRHDAIGDAATLRSVIAALLQISATAPPNSINVYANVFELPMLEHTSKMCETESRDTLGRCSAIDYLAFAEARVAKEAAIGKAVLDAGTATKLLNLVRTRLVGDHLLTIVNMEGSGFLAQLDQDRFDSLRRLYKLCAELPEQVAWEMPAELALSEMTRMRHSAAVHMLKDVMKAHIIRHGFDVMKATTTPKAGGELVDALLTLRAKYVRIVTQAFDGDAQFMTGVKEALVRVLNWQEPGRLAAAGPNRAPESLSLYVDERMKGEFKDMEAARLEASLDDVIALFRCLSAKDVFEEHYKNATARRLLSGRMPSEDVERLMISKLKAECGAAFTSKLEGMFMDLSKSAIFMEQYHTARGSSGSSGGAAVHDRRHMADFDATVLTSSNWAGSIQAGPVAQLPPPVSAALADFEAYYGERFNGRRLTWCYNKGTAEMRAWIGATSRPYELLVSTYQMIILYSFNSATEVSYKMLASLNIPEEELKRNLLSLLNPKLKLLNKSTARRDIDVDDTFTLCLPFTSKLVRVKVPLISLASAQQVAASASASAGAGVDAGSLGSATPAGASGGGAEDVAVVAAVEESRKALLESVIVRIMKSRKHIEHNALVAEVIRMVSARFTPTPADIKRRIEHLMDRDYIERAADNHNMYSYVA